MSSFGFISDDTLRAMIERDKREMDSCLEHRLAKSTMVLAGSIVEAVLVDYFLAFPPSGTSASDILRANLSDLIDWAEHTGVISSRSKDLSAVVRGYRNLIHPGKEYRMQEQVDENTATVAKHLVEIFLSEVSRTYADRLGYTADQALTKVCLDPGCTSIFPDLIDRMSVVERVKLFRAIPLQFSDQDFEVETVVQSLIQLRHQLSRQIPAHVVSEEAMRLYEFVQNKTKHEAMFHLRFCSQFLDRLSLTPRQTILTYVLSLLARSPSDELAVWQSWRVFTDLGLVLSDEQGAQSLIRSINTRLEETTVLGDDVFLAILQDILNSMSHQFSCVVVDALSAAAEYNWRASEWRATIVFFRDDDDVPF